MDDYEFLNYHMLTVQVSMKAADVEYEQTRHWLDKEIKPPQRRWQISFSQSQVFGEMSVRKNASVVHESK